MHFRTVGFTLIVIGMLMFGSGVVTNPFFHDPSSHTITTEEFANYTHLDNGLYVTIIPSNMTTETTCIDIAVNPASDGPGNISYLIPVKDLSIINYSNVQEFGIKESNNDSANIWFNGVPLGSYAFVESQNNSLGMSVVPELPLDVGGILTFVGAAMIVSGFIITVLSVAIRRTNR
ncbi:MAG: hypothetical protein ACYCSA_04050 [Thermoplasmataceae archaeon]